MVNPLLSFAFDTFLLGSAGVIVAGMIEEYRASRLPAAGRASRHLVRHTASTAARGQDVQALIRHRRRRFSVSVG